MRRRLAVDSFGYRTLVGLEMAHSSMKITEGVYVHLMREASHGEALSLETMLSVNDKKEIVAEKTMENAA
jgi:hypothetical protein